MEITKIIELLRERAMVGRMEVRDRQLMLKAADALGGKNAEEQEVVEVHTYSASQIRKALEICSTGECRGCPYERERSANCLSLLTSHARMLIKNLDEDRDRLGAEIERLRGGKSEWE